MQVREPQCLGSLSDVGRCLRTGAIFGAVFAAGELLSPYRSMRRLLGSDIHPYSVAIRSYDACRTERAYIAGSARWGASCPRQGIPTQ